MITKTAEEKKRKKGRKWGKRKKGKKEKRKKGKKRENVKDSTALAHLERMAGI